MSLPLDDDLKARFRLESFRPGQREVIEALERGDDVLAIMPTGSGKSLCYQLPAVRADGLTLVVSPLIALMTDQVSVLRSRGIAAAGLHGGMTPVEKRETWDAIAAGTLKLLFAAPERLAYDHMHERLSSSRIAHVIVDEAHCISQWGHDFRPEYRQLRALIAAVGDPPVGAFTATATPQVRRDIEVQLGIEGATHIFTGFDRGNLGLSVLPTPNGAEKFRAIRLLLERHPGPALLYTATRKACEEVAATLRKTGIAAVRYHAGLADEERSASQAKFLGGEAAVCVATCAFGMGVDKRDIRLVVHHAITDSLEAYYQEVGRAGRDGDPAHGVLLWSFPDVAIRRHLAVRSAAALSPELKAAAERRLDRIMRYADAVRCRRGFILEYFLGRPVPLECGMCDNCLGKNEMIAAKNARILRARPMRQEEAPIFGAGGGTGPRKQAATALALDPEQTAQALEWARMALSCVARLRRDTAAVPSRETIIAVLRGQRTSAVTAYELDKLSTWDLWAGWSAAEARKLLALLEDHGLLQGRAAFELTDLGKAVMRGTQPITLAFARRAAAGDVVIEKTESVSDEDGSADPAVQARLEEWRRRKAAGRPAYVILANRTLRAIAARRPATSEELAAIKGIGPMKLEQFGEEILKLVSGC